MKCEDGGGGDGCSEGENDRFSDGECFWEDVFYCLWNIIHEPDDSEECEAGEMESDVPPEDFWVPKGDDTHGE